MRNLIFLPAAVLAAAMLTTAVNADNSGDKDWHQDHHHGGHRHGGMMHEMKELNLSDAQKATIKGYFKASRGQLKPQFEAVRTQRQALEAATPGSPAFQSAAASLAQAESAAAGARVQQRAAMVTQIYGVLTAPQKAQWAKLQAEHQAKMAAWKARHREHEHEAQPAN